MTVLEVDILTGGYVAVDIIAYLAHNEDICNEFYIQVFIEFVTSYIFVTFVMSYL
jgi:hypothetical protein